jgi:[ribosomal protein S18]-alanine N-acetyltransferase
LIYSIRPLERDDLAAVNEIDREAFPTQWPPPNYRHELQNRLAHYLVAQDDSRPEVTPGRNDNRPKGFPSWFPLPWLKRPSSSSRQASARHYLCGFAGIWLLTDEAHITNIAVREAYRGRGLGELLLIAVADLSVSLGACILTLEVRVSNTVAQNLYLKYGFVKTGLRKGYYLDNREDAVIMTTEKITSESYRRQLQTLRSALASRLAPQP